MSVQFITLPLWLWVSERGTHVKLAVGLIKFNAIVTCPSINNVKLLSIIEIPSIWIVNIMKFSYHFVKHSPCAMMCLNLWAKQNNRFGDDAKKKFLCCHCRIQLATILFWESTFEYYNRWTYAFLGWCKKIILYHMVCFLFIWIINSEK